MKEDVGEAKVVKISITQKIDKFLEKKKIVPKNGQIHYIVDAATGERVEFESSVEASRSQSNRNRTELERKRRRFEKQILKKRIEKKKEKVKLEFSKKLKKLEEMKMRKIEKLKNEEEKLLRKIERDNERKNGAKGNIGGNEVLLNLGPKVPKKTFAEGLMEVLEGNEGEEEEREREESKGILKVVRNPKIDIEWKRLEDLEEMREEKRRERQEKRKKKKVRIDPQDL
jgi:hypothetical protein